MKKIYSLTMIAALALSFTACSNDDNVGSQYLRENTVKIVKSDVSFSAKASTGAIEFTAPAGATVKLNSTWASAAVEGNKINVSVLDNPKIEGRSAQLTIKAGEDSTNVTIQQQGMSFKYGGDAYYVYNDEAHSLQIDAPSEGAELKIKGLDWATASIDHSGIKIDMQENNTGRIRSGYIQYEAGPYKDSILVMQGQKSDILNNPDAIYYLAGYDMTQVTKNTTDISEVFTMIPGILAEDEKTGEMKLLFPDNNLSLPLAFDESTLSLVTVSGLPMGMYANTYYIYTSIVDSGWYDLFYQNGFSSLMSYNSNGQFLMMAAPATATDKAVYFYFQNITANNWLTEMLASFGYVSESATYDADCIGFTAYKKNSISASNYVGDLSLMYYPYICTYYDNNSEKDDAKMMAKKMAQKAQKQFELLKAENKLPATIAKIK